MQKAFLSLLLVSLPIAAQKPADVIVSAGAVLPMTSAGVVIPNGAVAIASGRILATGPRAEIDKAYTAKSRIDRPDAIILPGLVNAHTHAAMSLLRGLADDVSLEDWLRNHIFPAEAKNVTPDFVRAGTRLAMLEMLLGGTTTFVDMYYYEDTVAQAAKQAGMRAVLGQTIIGFPAPDFKTPQLALAGTEKFLAKWKNDPLITPAVAPHAVYTNSIETLRASKDLADRYNVPLLIHVSETQAENVSVHSEHRGTPTRVLVENGALARRTLFAHGVWLTLTDRMAMRERNIGLVHCPSSNTKLGSGILPLAEMMKSGIRIGLGTDGPAGSNNDFSMFEEMDLAAKLVKGTTHDLRTVSARTVVEMATIGGARALQMDHEIGSLEPGKRADLITVSTLAPHAVPAHDPYSMLAYTLKASDVQDVIIEGRTIVSDRKPLTLDPAEIIATARKIRLAVDASLKSDQPASPR